MNRIMESIPAVLCDFLVTATILLLIGLMVQSVLRQPIHRLLVDWGVCLGLPLLMVSASLLGRSKVELGWGWFVGERGSRGIAEAIVDQETSAGSHNWKTPETLPHERGVVKTEVLEVKTSHLNGEQADFVIERRNFNLPGISLQTVARWVSGVYLCGCGVILGWLAWGRYCLRKIEQRGVMSCDVIREELRRVVGEGEKLPRVLLSGEIQSAVAYGILSPAILLPMENSEERELGRLRMILAHEWGHIQNGDLWLLAASRVSLVLLYFHPLWHWLRREIERDQEFLADTAAAERYGREEYAANLLSMSRELSKQRIRWIGALGIGESSSPLSGRIEMLLNEKMRLSRKCGWGVRQSISLTTVLTVMGLSCLTLGSVGESKQGSDAAVGARSTAISDAESSDIEKLEEKGGLPEGFPGVSIEVPEKFTLRVLCVNEGGKPIENALVRAWVSGLEGYRQTDVPAVRTGADGKAVLKDISLKTDNPRVLIPEQVQVGLIVQAAGMGTEIYRGFLKDYLRNPGRENKVEMLPARTLKGRVVDTDGKGVAGAEIDDRQGLQKFEPGIRSAVTDQEGWFEITDLEAYRPKRYSYEILTVKHPDYVRQEFPTKAWPEKFDITLKKHTTIEGNVVLDESGSPVEKAEVEFFNHEERYSYYARTDAAGKFEAKLLPPGPYQVRVTADSRPVLGIKDFMPPKPGEPLTFRLKEGGTVTGRLIEVLTGKPVKSVYPGNLYLVSVGLNMSNHADLSEGQGAVGPDGRFEIKAPAGEMILAVGVHGETDSLVPLVGAERSYYLPIRVEAGKNLELEIKTFRPPEKEQIIDQDVMPASMEETRTAGEKAAIAAIRQLGGTITSTKVDGRDQVTEVDMVYTENEEFSKDRVFEDNTLLTDEVLPYLAKLPELRELHLRRTQASDAGMSELKCAPHLEKLMILEAWNITDEGMREILEFPSLTGIYLMDCQQLTDESLRLISKHTKLQDLVLNTGRFSDGGVEQLAECQSLLNLEVVSGTDALTNESLRHLSRLKNLKLLSIRGTGITDEGVKFLERMTGLETLCLVDTSVTGSGLEQLGRLSNLKHLELGGSKIKNEYLGFLKQFPELKILGLARTLVDDRGVEHLRRLKKLEMLTVDQMRVSDEAVRELRKEIPGVQVSGIEN